MSYGPLINYGTQLDDFEATTGWTAANGTWAANTTHFRTGTQSLRLAASGAGVSPNAVKTLAGSPIDMSGFRTFSIDVYCHSDPVTTIASVAIYLDVGSSGNEFQASYAGAALVLGWNRLTFVPSDFSVAGSADWAAIRRVRVRLNAISGQTPDASFDNLRHDFYGVPCIMFCFDDVPETAVTEGVAYLTTKGLAATLYIDHDLTGTAGQATEAQLATAVGYGCVIGNHAYAHTDPNTLTADEIETSFRRNADYIESLGYTRASRHAASPYTIQPTATTLQGYRQAGMLTAGHSQSRPIVCPVDSYLNLGRNEILSTSVTLAQAKAKVDRAIALGQTNMLLFHKLVASPGASTEWAISDFQALVDYVAAYAVAGTIVCTTIDRWFTAGMGPSLVWDGTGWK